jgi:flagellar basal body-associated protein FliL
MNLKFWKKKKAPEESSDIAADETIVAAETDPTPAKPGFWTRLKSTLLPSRKKIGPDNEEESTPSGTRKNDKHQDEESEAPPPKPGFLARLRNSLMPSRKKDRTEDEEKTEERQPSTKRADKNHREDEPESSDVPEKKSGKKLVIALALLIPLAAGGGFFAATKLLPKRHQEAPPAITPTSQEIKDNGQPVAGPAETAEQAPQPETDQSPNESAPQQSSDAPTPIAEVAEPQAEPPGNGAPAPSDEDIQTQIETLKKHNQKMQAEIEMLKKQPAVARPARTAATPREGVLIINGKNAKESAQGLKKIIEDMNADPGEQKPAKPANK